MIYCDINQALFDLVLTLGDEDTNSPPPLLLVFDRHGTNDTGTHPLSVVGIQTGDRFVIYVDVPTSIFPRSGQYDYFIYNNTVPATPVLIESGLLEVLDTPITKDTYGTDKERGEYKGHI